MKSYKYKMYTKAKRGVLDNQINRFALVYNHCIDLHREYYNLTGKNLDKYTLMRHLSRIKHRPIWKRIFNDLDAQAVQNVAERIDRAYKGFFRNKKKNAHASHPRYKSFRKYSSYTLKKTGYKFDNNKVRLNGAWYGFHKSRDWKGTIKTVTIKRDRCGDFYVIITTDWNDVEKLPTSGKSVGFDFGMKTFLIASDGEDIEAPQFLQRSKLENFILSRAVFRKMNGSRNRQKALLRYTRFMRHIVNQRADFQWKLANRLVREYDVMCFENLDIRGMSDKKRNREKRIIWKSFNRKLFDYSYSAFLSKLKIVAAKHGKDVRIVDRFFPSSKTCCYCGYKNNKLRLSDRKWRCPNCGHYIERDWNAAVNILREGTSSLGVTVVSPRSVESGECQHSPKISR